MRAGGHAKPPGEPTRKNSSKGQAGASGAIRTAFRKASALDTGADLTARLRASLRQWGQGRTLVHQFRLVANRAPKPATTTRSPPPVHGTGERWQSYRVTPIPTPGLAAVKYAQQENAAPVVPRSRRDRPSSLGELYEYFKRNGRLEEFLSLFPGP